MGLDLLLINNYVFLFLSIGMFLAFHICCARYKFSYNYSVDGNALGFGVGMNLSHLSCLKQVLC